MSSWSNGRVVSLTIRPAAPEEADFLTALALRSKAVWGYDEAFMAACRAELTVSPDREPDRPVRVLEIDDRIVGFHGLDRLDAETAELDYLFVEPDALGQGHGRRLFVNACEVAKKELGCRRLLILGDPNAERFYLSMGAHQIGERPSGSIEGRRLPLFEYTFAGPGRGSDGAALEI